MIRAFKNISSFILNIYSNFGHKDQIMLGRWNIKNKETNFVWGNIDNCYTNFSKNIKKTD